MRPRTCVSVMNCCYPRTGSALREVVAAAACVVVYECHTGRKGVWVLMRRILLQWNKRIIPASVLETNLVSEVRDGIRPE